MRSKLGKECRKLFRKMMTVQFPEYKEDKGQVVPPGWYVWTRCHPPNLYFHILLVIHDSRDQFTIESGWSFDGKLTNFYDQDGDRIYNYPNVFRLNFLWCDRDYWWSLVLRPEEYERSTFRYKEDPIEQCLPLVAPAVWDAGEKLKEYFLPICEKVVQKHGKKTGDVES